MVAPAHFTGSSWQLMLEILTAYPQVGKGRNQQELKVLAFWLALPYCQMRSKEERISGGSCLQWNVKSQVRNNKSLDYVKLGCSWGKLGTCPHILLSFS